MQTKEQFQEIDLPARILLGPGPSMVHPRILRAMAHPLVGHLDPQFIQLMNSVQELLRYTFQTNNSLTIPVSGTGSAAMEASLCNFLEPGDKIIICVNGYFGERLVNMASRYGADIFRIDRKWGEIFDPEEISVALKKFPAKIVAIVHAETSTGALQPLEEISRIVHNYGALFLVDCVTSLSGIPLSIDKLGIDIAYSGTQKCLSCPPGLSPLTVNDKAKEVLLNRKNQVANWYLDLSTLSSYWGSERTYHHTAPISMIYALYEALRIVHEEGLENRYERHKTHAKLFWDGLEDMGLKLVVPEAYRLPTLTTIWVPDGVDEAKVRMKLLEDYNIEIAGGLGIFKGKAWRVGLMGYSSKKEWVLLLLSALKKILG